MTTPVKEFILFIDVIFSYLYAKKVLRGLANPVNSWLRFRWITAFIFTAVNYNQNNCHRNAPPGVVCSKKWALEAFVFLTLLVIILPPIYSELRILAVFSHFFHYLSKHILYGSIDVTTWGSKHPVRKTVIVAQLRAQARRESQLEIQRSTRSPHRHR